MKKLSSVAVRVAAGLLVFGSGNLLPSTSWAQATAVATAQDQPQTVEERSKALASLLDEIWQDRLKHSPEFASFLGDKRYNDQWSDYSVQEVNASLARGRVFIDRLGAIDTTGLKSQEILSRDLMIRDLTDAQEAARFKEWEMPVNQFSGFHTDIVQLVNNLTFETVKDYDDYITRLKKIPTVFSQNMTDMQLGMDEGRVPPAYLLEKVVAQTEAIANQKPEESPFAAPLKKFPASISTPDRQRITQEMAQAIVTTVLPTYARFARFLKAQYVPAGRKEPGVWSLPDGDAYYAFRVRQSTTMDKSPEEIHEIGLEQVKRDEAEMLVIVKKLGFQDIKSFSAAMKTNPKLHPTSKEALIDSYKNYIAQMQPKLPQLFGTLPKAKLEVVPVPAYIEKDQAAAYYDPGSPDGKRPGRVYINTYNFADRSLASVEAVAYHEGVPGHHLQISIAQELTGLPEFRKQEYFTAYTEGWGLYSERLGKEIGFYQDPYSDYGRLEADIWRAIRLVVDTGVHYKHWTRQQMVDYFHDHSAIDEPNIQAEVDRYIAWPGQALGYKMGQLKILELRQKAQTALGPKFDLKAFHDVVLDSGALPMDLLEKQVDAWIAAQKK
ncbi:DUF885 domain-containing protein [Edaphobacter albus]|uniref:DUF885 domain-containing protein n=1 Tax=Edaphobacter sp. 4G125 TaxID=2763071 RepID=UPI001647EA27|nr:DUF885 domain-containing protein [Edaphobacter sp. 4G125]QNI38245.1 DUF885 domain-containing protein [Edaphobacter sp. 4G125]